MITVDKKDDGRDLITLENDYLKIVVTNWGCRVISIFMDDRYGNNDDVVLGYEKLDDYIDDGGTYLGAFVGRVANRIGNASFELNGQTYNLAVNNGPNCLHGGNKGLDQKIFHYEIEGDSITFSTYSPHLEENFPGDLIVMVTYTLDKETLTMNYKAASNVDTLVNFTNHSYFNLSNKVGPIDEHILKIKADRFNHVDENGLAIKEEEDVEGTPFDFRKPSRIGDKLYLEHPQLKLGNGFDHHFIFNDDHDQVILYNKENGRKLTISSTLPGAQIYSANFLNENKGKYGDIYQPRYALCIETQNRPDSIHIEDEPTTILKKGTWYDESTSYTFSIERH